MTDSAPFRYDLVQGAERASAYWVRASDGPRLRISVMPAETSTPRGTILMFLGRGEYIEKYAHTAVAFSNVGYCMATIEWRGQGLSDRLLADPKIGHVDAFLDYQKDVDALMNFARAQNLPKPFYLVAHSMGGAIALRSLVNGLPAKAVVFSGPMWGLHFNVVLRPIVWGLLYAQTLIKKRTSAPPGAARENYFIKTAYEDNVLTSDPAKFSMVRDHVIAETKFGLAGPTAGWTLSTLLECRALTCLPSPDVPCITYLGTDESVVDIHRIHDRMSHWPNGRLDIVPMAKHEIFAERAIIRQRVLAESVTLFSNYH
ncbi:MAG: alpha/beta hydrolase [Pseudoprimorskyibacter sp.]|jgi:lysophospholipase|nr:alpha/beta hydrolase [Pseudoprimorskyibacter sp.]